MPRKPGSRRLGAWSLAFVIVAAYPAYRIGWGHPFTFRLLAERQQLIQLANNPQALTDVGLIDGTWLDWHSDELTPVTLERRDEDYARAARFLEEVHRFDRARLNPEDAITYDVLENQWQTALSFRRFPWLTAAGLYPLGPMDGAAAWVPGFLQFSHVVRNARSAEHYVARLHAFGTTLDGATAAMQWQATQGVVMPLALVDRSLEIIRNSMPPEPADSALVAGFRERLAAVESLDAARRLALGEQAEEAVRNVVYPALARAAAALEAAKPTASKREAGVADLPDGPAYYAARLAEMITTGDTPDEVHALGLTEVARITKRMDELLQAQGLGDGTVGQRMQTLAHDPRQLLPNTEAGRAEILKRYQQILDDMAARLPGQFRDPPADRLVVQRVPEAQQAAGAGAYYTLPAMDGSRPGMFFVNLRDLSANPVWSMKTLAYHEGVPGHHLQTVVALRQHELPLVRRLGWYTAYGEGWALYAERLAAEMGLYDNDPMGDLGRLQAELMRAVRLVVDTGLHARHWSREQAIDYMASTTGLERAAVTSEVERYMEIPGQACAYKIGQLKLLALREEARAALGPRFDPRDFHAVVLESGALPLSLLEKRVRDYVSNVASRKRP